MNDSLHIEDFFRVLSTKINDRYLYNLYLLYKDILPDTIDDTEKYANLMNIVSSQKLFSEDLKKINDLNILLLQNIIAGLHEISIVNDSNAMIELLDSNIRYVQLLLVSRTSNMIADTVWNTLKVSENEKLKNELFGSLLISNVDIGNFRDIDFIDLEGRSVIRGKFAQCASDILDIGNHYSRNNEYIFNDVAKIHLFILALADFKSVNMDQNRKFENYKEYYGCMIEHISAILTSKNFTESLLNQNRKLSELVKDASIYAIVNDRFYNGSIINPIYFNLQEHFIRILKDGFPNFQFLSDREKTSVIKSSDIFCNEVINLLLHDIEYSKSCTVNDVNKCESYTYAIINSFYKVFALDENISIDYIKYMNLFNITLNYIIEIQNREEFPEGLQCRIISTKIENNICHINDIARQNLEHIQFVEDLDNYENKSDDDFLHKVCQSELAMILSVMSYRASDDYQLNTTIFNAYHNGFANYVNDVNNDKPSNKLYDILPEAWKSYFLNIRSEVINHLDCDRHNRLSNGISAESVLSLNNKSDVAFKPANYAKTNFKMRELYKNSMLDFIDFHKLEDGDNRLNNIGRLIVDSVSSKIKRGQIHINESGKLLRNLISFFVPRNNKEEFLVAIENFITNKKESSYINNLNLYYSHHNHNYVPISDVEQQNKMKNSLEKIASYVKDSGENIDLRSISDSEVSIADVFLVINNITNNMIAALVTDSTARKKFYLSADIVDLYLTLESFSSLRNELLERGIFIEGDISLTIDTQKDANIAHFVSLVCFDHLQIMEESVSRCAYDSYLAVQKKNVDIDNNKTKILLTNIVEMQKLNSKERAIMACYNKFTEKLDSLNIYNSKLNKDLDALLKDINKREGIGITIKNHCKTLSEKYDFVLCMVYFSLLTSAIVGNYLGQRAFEGAKDLADTLNEVNNGDLNILDILHKIPEDIIHEQTSNIVQSININNIREQLQNNLFSLNTSSEIADFYSNNSYPGLPINPISLVSSCVAVVSYFWSLGIQIPSYYANFMSYNEQIIFKNLVTGNNSPEVNEKIVHLALGKKCSDITDFTLQDYSRAAIKSTSQILSSHLYIPTPSSIKESQIMALGFSAWFSGTSLSRLMGNFYAEFGDAMPNNANLLFPLYMVYDLYAVIASLGGEKASGLMSDFMYLQADFIKELFQKLGNRNAMLTVYQEKMLINILGSENYEKIKDGIIVDKGLESGLSDLSMTRKYKMAAQAVMAVTNASEFLTFSYTGCDSGRLFDLINVDTPAQVARDTAREIFAVQQSPLGVCPIEGAKESVHAPDSFTQRNCQFFAFNNERQKPQYNIGELPFPIWRSIFTNLFGKILPTAAATSINLCMRKEIGIEHSDNSPVKHVAKGMLFKDLIAGTISQVFGMSTNPLNRKVASGVDSLGTILGDLMVKKAISGVEMEYNDVRNYVRQNSAKLHSDAVKHSPYISSASIISTGDYVLSDTRTNALIGNVISKISDKFLQDTENIAEKKSFEDLIYIYRAKMENASDKFMNMQSDEYDSAKFVVDELQNDIKNFHHSDLKCEKDFLCHKLSDKMHSSSVQIVKFLSCEMQNFQQKHTENCVRYLSDVTMEKERNMDNYLSLGN
ncbi:hypothetical protein GUI12_01840 [Anaplasmataceae bacterium AB001_6]|nr:hypothetical protein GUI12_01840 [Anaplasmataceae bacterium AB001_6]